MSQNSKKLASPVLFAWAFLVLFWPLSDALRKWGGLNQPAYALQMLVPFIICFFLFRQNALYLHRDIKTPALLLTLSTGLIAFYHSITNYSLAYLGVWFLSLSALIGPLLLLCVKNDIRPVKLNIVNKQAGNLVSIISILFFTNNILSIAQSILGRSHFLSASAGGALDAQIRTNTAIELRAPGFFTFVLGSANFSAICTIFLLSSFLVVLPVRASILRSLAFLSFPIALARSISRGFLFLILTVILPWIRFIITPRVVFAVLFLISSFLVLSYLYPNLFDLLNDGLANFQQRIDDADGVTDGVIIRFIDSFFAHIAYEKDSLFFNLLPWFRDDSFSMLLGLGLGYSGPLFRFSQGISDIYGFINVNGKVFLLGETFYPSLLAELGVVNIALYFWLVVNSIRFFLRSFPLLPFIRSRVYVHASFIAFILALVNPTTPYFRPLSVLFLSATVLTPFVCKYLFGRERVGKATELIASRQPLIASS